jgi:hypothetical protein
MPLLPREGWHITACHQLGPSALELNTAPLLFDRRSPTVLKQPRYDAHSPHPPPYTRFQVHVSRGLRFLGTVPETDVLEVANKRNMRSKFR